LVVTNVRDITQLNTLRSQLEESRRINSSIYQTLQEHDGIEHTLEKLVIKSQSMIQVVKKAIKVAGAETSILLLGESGVGKSMLAGIIHKMSPRKEGPFIKINCGAIPYSLMESELFGYEKGAFTGALHTGKAGLIEIAHQGTVFLDEVGELKPDMQVKLLEVLENKTFKKIGSTQSTKIDINIIAATNRDLKTMIKDGDFREDLYYRLNVVPISIPPLRKRKEDILPLVINVLEKFNKQKKLKKSFLPETLDRLRKYNFPGNVRELVNIVERMIILSDGDQIIVEDLPESMKEEQGSGRYLNVLQGSLKERVADVEARIIQEALSRCKTISETSKELNLHPTSLWRKMVKYGIKKDFAKMQ
jgi:transcriptional regulator with PAS, ATPase and Fis domain